MKTLTLAVLLLAAPAFAGRRCKDGSEPRLTGDLFSPAACSAATAAAAPLPGLSVVLSARDTKTDLRDLEGRWEGTLIHALGRYEILLTVNAGRGKTELLLDTKELQFRDRLTDTLVLTPAKERGAFSAVMTSSLAPDASLKGETLVGSAVPPALKTTAEKSPAPDRQADTVFENGAKHRFYFALKDKNELRLRAFSSIPGAPLQTFELTLTRTKREKL